MNDFIASNIITIWVVVFVVEVLLGLLAQSIAEGKGHSRRWFWAGFLLSIVGVIWAAGLPDETLREQMRRFSGSAVEAQRQNTDAGMTATPTSRAPDDGELAAVLSAAVAAYGQEEGKRFELKSFRPVGEGSTAWNRAGRTRHPARGR